MNTLIRSPPQPAPLSSHNAYTTWPGGVDPSTPLFNTDNQKIGGRRLSRKSSRKSARKSSRKSARKSSRKNSRR
jgi:hypothetical protein